MSHQVEQPEIKPAANGSTVSGSSLGKIIVVDDEPELKNILVKALSAQGFEVTGCSSGQHALAELREKEFDLLLTDLMMPEMDGLALLEAALKVDPYLVGVMMTGQGTIQTAVDAMKVGAFDYVLKPFRLQTVMPVLTRAINTRRLSMENLQLRETVAIYGLCQTIAFTLDAQTVLSRLADAALQQSDADEVSILLPTDDGKELYVAVVRGEKRERLLGERVPLQESISSWVARERAPLILNGEVRDKRFVAVWPRPEINSAVTVPMQVANKLVGIINLNMTSRLRPFTLGQMKALTILAGTAAAALESASLHRQVREAEENYRSIFENAVEGIFQSTPEGRFMTVNPACARIFGYDSPEEMIAGITDIAHQLYVDPDDRVEAARLQEERGVLEGFEFEAYRKDGTKIWLSENRRAVRTRDGRNYFEGSVENITERKSAEKERTQLTAEIGDQRERLDNIVASVPGVVWEAWGQPDAETQRINFVSNYVETMLGYTIEEWLSTPNFWLTIVHPDDKEEAARVASESFASGNKSLQEFRWIAKDGREVWVESNCVVVIGENGRPAGMRGVNTDIGERKRAEDQLRQARDFSENLIQTANVIILGLDVEGNINTFNQAAEEITGYTVVEVKGRSWFEKLVPKDRYPYVWDEFSRVVGGGIPKAFENPILTKSGEERYIMWQNNQVMVDGKVVAMISFGNDITERKRAEERLRESEERYRLLFESNPQPMWVYDLETLAFLAVNESAVHHYGYSREDFLAMTLKDISPAEDIPALYASVARRSNIVDDGRIWRHLKKDGTLIEVEITSHLLVFDDRRAELILAHDVTQRNRLESALFESEEQLRQSQKLEAIGQLAGGVAHDFNNLLTVIGGYSSILLHKLPTESPHLSSVEEIKKASDRATALTRQLLAFSRKQILQPKVLDLNIVVTDLEKMVRRLIGEDIDFATITSPVLGKVKADPGGIEQVLLNLIVNGRDAMPKGGKLTIETGNVVLSEDYAQRHAAQPGPYVMLAVSDTGCGMDATIQPRIFDPFFTTKGPGKGTGLGLATVYGIVKQSGGNIWVYSEVGRGTTFKIYLPRVDEARVEGEALASSSVPQGTELILLVEDEDQVRVIMEQILKGQGYRVLAASNGNEALSISQDLERDIKLMITDVVMPQMSGRELAERVLAIRPNLPVLFMSGYTDDAIVRHGLLDERLNFIQKPFDFATVARKVREVLDSP